MIFLALGTAFCTGLAAIIISEVAVWAGGALTISCWRTLTAALALTGFAAISGHLDGLGLQHMPLVVGSSLAAAVMGEFCLNYAYRDLGARRAALLFATAAPFSVVIGWLFLGEIPPSGAALGIMLVVAGLSLAIWFTPLHESRSDRHKERAASLLAIGVGLAAGLGQALGNGMARSALTQGADPISVMLVRAIVATIAFWSMWMVVGAVGRQQVFAPPPNVLAMIVLGAFVSFALGNTLLMIALRSGETGIVTTFAATTPVMLLPMTWWRSSRCPSARAWLGAALTVAGIACIALF